MKQKFKMKDLKRRLKKKKLNHYERQKLRDMNGFQKKKNQYSLRKWLIWSLEQEMEKDTLRITCAEKEERYQRLLGPCKKYAGDKYKLSIKKNIAFNVLKQIHYKCNVFTNKLQTNTSSY